MSGDIYAAKQSFSIRWNGHPLVVHTGSTIREGHPLLVAYPSLFSKLLPDFEYEAPKPPPVKATPPPPAEKAVAPPVVKAAVPPASAKTD